MVLQRWRNPRTYRVDSLDPGRPGSQESFVRFLFR